MNIIGSHAVDPGLVTFIAFRSTRFQVEGSDLALTGASEEPIIFNVQRFDC